MVKNRFSYSFFLIIENMLDKWYNTNCIVEVDSLEDDKNLERLNCSFFENTDELKNVLDILNNSGYDSIKQVTDYLISGDPGYISNYKGARKILNKYDRSEIVEFLLRNYYK